MEKIYVHNVEYNMCVEETCDKEALFFVIVEVHGLSLALQFCEHHGLLFDKFNVPGVL